MDSAQIEQRLKMAIRMTAPGTALRSALDMILAARLGALICIGDTDKVLAGGNDGFPLNIAFTSHRLFELSKMDGAIVVDEEVSNILRANFHLNPDPDLPTTETGMRHRTAARMSMSTDALVISVSERRAAVNIFIGGRSYQLRSDSDLINEANQMLIALQTQRSILDRGLTRLSALEFDDFVTLGDVTAMLARFQTLIETGQMLHELLLQMGTHGRMLKIQLREQTHGMDEQFTLMIRDYAANSSLEHALNIRENFSLLSSREMTSPQRIAEILGYPQLQEEDAMHPLGLRTLLRVPVVSSDIASRLVDRYGSLRDLVDEIQDRPEHLGELGVNNTELLLDSLYRMWGKKR